MIVKTIIVNLIVNYENINLVKADWVVTFCMVA